jgi:hypothetical protein
LHKVKVDEKCRDKDRKVLFLLPEKVRFDNASEPQEEYTTGAGFSQCDKEARLRRRDEKRNAPTGSSPITGAEDDRYVVLMSAALPRCPAFSRDKQAYVSD